MRSRNDFIRPGRPARAGAGFYVHLAAYLAVNALLVCVNLLTTPGRLWFHWPVLGWGIGLLAHALAAFALPLLRTPRGASID